MLLASVLQLLAVSFITPSTPWRHPITVPEGISHVVCEGMVYLIYMCLLGSVAIFGGLT